MKTTHKVFYYILTSILLIGIVVYGFDNFQNSHLLVGFFVIYILVPILIISLLIILISNFNKFGFLNGIKESSINIFALLLSLFLLWTIWSYAFEKSNQINVKVINETELGISNIKLIGRNAISKIDTLSPNQNKTIVFKGKRINYKTENDYENEIRLLYYFDNKWRENKILCGFGRWQVINKDWEIKIYSADSIQLK